LFLIANVLNALSVQGIGTSMADSDAIVETGHKRSLEDALGHEERQEDLRERRLKFDQTMRAQQLQNLQCEMDVYMRMNDGVMDDEGKLAFRDRILALTAVPAAVPHPIPLENPSRKGFIYIMNSAGQPNSCKLGRSVDPRQREGALNTGRANDPLIVRHKLYCEDAIESEKIIHEVFKSARQNGEFFGVTVAQAKEGYDWLEKKNRSEDVEAFVFNAGGGVVEEPYRFLSAILNRFPTRKVMYISLTELYYYCDYYQRIDDLAALFVDELTDSGIKIKGCKKSQYMREPWVQLNCREVKTDLKKRKLYDDTAALSYFEQCGNISLHEPLSSRP
jgi:T5orf172 domain